MINRTHVAGLVVAASLLVGIATKEGYVETAAPPVPGDVATNGYGTTEGVKLGDKTDPVRALIRLSNDVDKFANAVKRCAPVPMYQHEFNAYVSLTYNIGEIRFCASSIPAKLKSGNYDAACLTILDFVCGPADEKTRAKPGDRCYSKSRPLKVIRGLYIRRQEEYKECKGE